VLLARQNLRPPPRPPPHPPLPDDGNDAWKQEDGGVVEVTEYFLLSLFLILHKNGLFFILLFFHDH